MNRATTILVLSLVFILATLSINKNFVAKPDFDLSLRENTKNRLEVKVLPTGITNSIYDVKFYDSNGLEIAHKTINQEENVYSIDDINKYTYPITVECRLQFDRISSNIGTFTKAIIKPGV